MNLEQFPKQETKNLSKEELTNLLKKNAIDILGEGLNYKLIETQKTYGADENIKPFTWNENSGVLIFRDDHDVYVTRATGELRNSLFKSLEYTRDSQIGVPAVNDGGIWKSKSDWENFKRRWESSN